MTAVLHEPGVVEIRNGEGFDVADVNFPKRTVTLVVMPYERPAVIAEPGRVYTEVVTRGAFDGIERRTSKIKAFRGHNTSDRVVGKVVGLHPSRTEGLVADVKMFTTPMGEETLILCNEGGLEASAGFALLRDANHRVHQDAEVWDRSRTVRRLNKLRLDHVALVPNPAYEDAVVLDVRDAPRSPQEPAGAPETPNRDRLLILDQQAFKAELDRRWL